MRAGLGDDVDVKAAEVRFGVGEVRLSGTVWAPGRQAPTPGVVLVGGSGPSDRTNGGYFDAVRDRLVAAGVTVLAFDKRGVGGSTGAWASARVDDLAADVAGAVEVLRAHPGGSAPTEVEVKSRFIVYRNRVETETDFLVGKREDLLRRVAGDWRIARRKIVLDQNVLLAKNLTVFF